MPDKDILDELLESPHKAAVNFEIENSILEPLLEEIDLIQDPMIASFVRSMLLKAHIFWEIPSSFSGRYHPPDEREEGGNVLHTKRVVRTAEILCESYGLGTFDKNLIFAACILHDLTKGVLWPGEELPSYDPMHPYTVDRAFHAARNMDIMNSETESSVLSINDEYVQQILRLIRCHMGPWSPIPETIPTTIEEMIVHLADNIACKLHVIVDGDEIIEERWAITD